MTGPEIDPWEYNNHSSDCISESNSHSGDKCPCCGKCFRYDEPGVKENGTRGDIMDLAPEEVGDNIWCKKCWPKVKHVVRGDDNMKLGEFK